MFALSWMTDEWTSRLLIAAQDESNKHRLIDAPW